MNKMENYLISKGLKVWEKGEYKRIYIDVCEFGIEKFTINPKSFKGISIYYNCKDDKFYFSVSNSRKSTISEYIDYLRNEAEKA